MHSTMIIMPVMKMMVLQLMPVFSSPSPWSAYQKPVSAMLWKLSASHTAAGLRMQQRKTTTMVTAPARSATR